MIETRELERAIESKMSADAWPDMPQRGDSMATAFTKVLNYIEWLRQQNVKLWAVADAAKDVCRYRTDHFWIDELAKAIEDLEREDGGE